MREIQNFVLKKPLFDLTTTYLNELYNLFWPISEVLNALDFKVEKGLDSAFLEIKMRHQLGGQT